MTSLGSPGLSSQSVLGFSRRKKSKNAETDWDDKPGKPSCHPSPFRVFLAEKGPKNLETDWDDKPGEPRLVIPVRFGVFSPKRAQKYPKWAGRVILLVYSLCSFLLLPPFLCKYLLPFPLDNISSEPRDRTTPLTSSV